MKPILFLNIFLIFISVNALKAADYMVTNVASNGPGTLYEGIVAANASNLNRPFVIEFSVPAGSVINQLEHTIPLISRAVIIDATTHPAYNGTPVIRLNGRFENGGHSSSSGLLFYTGSDGSLVKGLTICGFRYGISVKSSNIIIEKNRLVDNVQGMLIRSGSSNVKVRGNYVGKESNNTYNFDGILIENSSDITIGGPSVTDGNIISNNKYKGIWIRSGTSNISVLNNKIGTDANGMIAAPNQDGVYIGLLLGQNTVYNSDVVIEKNIISGNSNNGVLIYRNEGTGIKLSSNIIGLSIDQTKALANKHHGIQIDNSRNILIGGDNSESGNIIGAHKDYDNSMGIYLQYSNAITIKFNRIGNNSEEAVFSNNRGIFFNNVANSVISSNIVSGNVYYNILIVNGEFNLLTKNKIGTDESGNNIINTGSPDGININNSYDNLIGGSLEDANIICGNQNGVYGDNANRTILGYNIIGLNPSQNKALSNSNGFFFSGSSNVTITGNIISGNSACGGIVRYSSYVQVKDNYFGVTSGLNPFGNGETGLSVRSSSQMLITGNIIGDNFLDGIEIREGSGGNTLYGNYIGTDETGERNLRNKADGIAIKSGSNYNFIGGIGSGQPNKIAYNLGSGVSVSQSVYNKISGNPIYRNSSRGINLLISDTSAVNDGNNSKPKPVINTVTLNSGNLELTGTYISETGNDTLQFFVSDENGEGGYRFLSAYTLATTSSSWSVSIPLSEVSGGYIAVTATDLNSNTSEFSLVAGITNCPSVKPAFTIIKPCEDKPVITQKQVTFDLTNHETGFLYEWHLESSSSKDVTSTAAQIYYGFSTGGSKSITVAKRIANCSVLSDPQILEVKELILEADNNKLCEGETALISVTPNDLPGEEYIWHRYDQLLENTGPNYQADKFGVYKITIRAWDCPEEGQPEDSGAFRIAAGITEYPASKTVLIEERVCIDPLPPCGRCLPQFFPEPNKKYILSAWVLEDDKSVITGYIRAGIKLNFTVKDESGQFVADSNSVLLMQPSGPVIDGWQKIEKEFTVPTGMVSMEIVLKSSDQVDIYYDDLRIFPKEGNAKTFVYDPATLRLMSVLDENNFATFYEYDQEGKLIRVKKETEKGIVTLQENLNNLHKR